MTEQENKLAKETSSNSLDAALLPVCLDGVYPVPLDVTERVREHLVESRRAVADERPTMRFMRQDVITGKWVLFELGKGPGTKPRQIARAPKIEGKLVGEEPSNVEGCPFCVSTVPEACDILRYEPTDDGYRLVQDWSKAGSSGPWQLRVVRNIFPSMSVPKECYHDGFAGGFLEDSGHELNPNTSHPWYMQTPAVGYNDVIVEFPEHNKCIALAEPAQVALIFQAAVLRGRELQKDARVRYVTVFKQHKCGSLIHAHSQIITTPMVPSLIENILLRSALLHEKFEQCVLHRILVTGPTSSGLARERLVLESEHFVVSVPFACRDRWRVYIAPRRHCSDFFQITDGEVQDLACVLRKVLGIYYYKLGDVPFNLAVMTEPCNSPAGEVYAHSFLWFIGIYPRSKAGAQGFKNATDIAGMRTLPEDDAAQMRAWLAEIAEGSQS